MDELSTATPIIHSILAKENEIMHLQFFRSVLIELTESSIENSYDVLAQTIVKEDVQQQKRKV